MQKNIDTAALLREHGLKKTSSRLSVLSALSRLPRPATVEEIHRSLPSPRPDITTVYRTIESFVAAGIATMLNLKNGEAHVELAHAHDTHHIVCVSCDTVEHFDEKTHVDLAVRAVQDSKQFAKLIRHSFELYGICTPCAKNSVTNQTV
jgi:Fur family transcriptional regulator, ferric uptake regulator